MEPRDSEVSVDVEGIRSTQSKGEEKTFHTGDLDKKPKKTVPWDWMTLFRETLREKRSLNISVPQTFYPFETAGGFLMKRKALIFQMTGLVSSKGKVCY